ncbi:MAG: ornithine aminomutase subunit alpha [Candidatus Izemoplasmatales bacterium]
MNKRATRPDDYEKRRQHIKDLTDEQLKEKFWDLADQTVNPLIELAYKNTSPAIERSVVLRMGFSSIEAKDIVEKTIKHGLISKGAGHVIYRLSQLENMTIRVAGLALIDNQGWDKVKKSFGVSS